MATRFKTSGTWRTVQRGVPFALSGILALWAAGCACKDDAPAHPAQTQGAGSPLRLGTYDSRAVAIAFGRSASSNQKVSDLMTRHKKAVEAGDTKLAEELERTGESLQVRLHMQAFSNAPVDDALDAVRAELGGVADKAGVSAIVSDADYHAASVELVDVTDDIVALFHPDRQTLKVIAECRRQRPMPIEVIARLPADK